MHHVESVHNFIDLTASSRPGLNSFSDDEDEIAFGNDQNLCKLYKRDIWRLKHNDPNFRLLHLSNTELSREVSTRIGICLWQSQYVKAVHLCSCGLSGSSMEHLFGKIARQNETNTYLSEEDILGKLGVNEQSLLSSVLECVTSFSGLVKVDVSHNYFGTHGLDVLVKSLAGCPIEDLDLTHCALHGIFPLSGTRHCRRLKKLDISGNRLGIDDADTVTMLMDNEYPKLPQFDLMGCGITDDFVETISPALSKNKSLRYINMRDLARGTRTDVRTTNKIGDRGVAALTKAIHDSSTFEKTLASNHTIWKINVDGAELFPVTFPNFSHRHHIGWCKYIKHFVQTTEVVDMTPFMDLNINLIPNIISAIDRDVSETVALSACYKIWSCKMFRERIGTASQVKYLQARNDSLKVMVEELGCAQTSVNKKIEQLQDENATLTEQIAMLLASKLSNEKIKKNEGSIGEKVAKRKISRKRGRRDFASNAEPLSLNNKIEMFEGSIGERVKKKNISRNRGRRDIF